MTTKEEKMEHLQRLQMKKTEFMHIYLETSHNG